ncbi:MAG: MYXO-CTERM sorting domain-containing protein, partial [Polyangiaceae bacterium]
GAYEFGAGNLAGAGGAGAAGAPSSTAGAPSSAAGASSAPGGAGSTTPPAGDPKHDSGCSCRATGVSDSVWSPFALLAALSALFCARFRARRHQ